MRQVWTARHGGPEVLEVREASDPEPLPGEVRVRVHASGVNFADILIRIGLYPDAPPLPAVVGYEIAGVVETVGNEVVDVAPETRVLALLPAYGGYSDVVCIPAEEAVPIPDSLSFETAASIPVNYLTAWLMLVRLGNVRRGQSVLVHGAAGGVGQAALQICRWRDARVIATASAGKHERLKQVGAESCIDYRTQDFEAEVLQLTNGTGVDLALDGLGGHALAKSYRCLAPLGRVFTFGVSSLVRGGRRSWPQILVQWWRMPRFNPIKLLTESRGVIGFNLGALKHESVERRQALKEILALVDEGELRPQVDTAFPFERAAEAHRYLQDRRNFGKVVLTPEA